MSTQIRQALGGLVLAAILGVIALVSSPDDRGSALAATVCVALVSLAVLAWNLLRSD